MTCSRSISPASQTLRPAQVRIGLSATVAASERAACLSGAADRGPRDTPGGPAHGARAGQRATSPCWKPIRLCLGPATPAATPRPDILEAIRAHRLSLLFVNTRSQAELLFQELWRLNEDSLPIALHHGSPRRGAAAQGRSGDGSRTPCAPWCRPQPSISAWTGARSTSSSMSAHPKGASRLLQRVGRANHRLEEASRRLAGAVESLRGP